MSKKTSISLNKLLNQKPMQEKTIESKVKSYDIKKEKQDNKQLQQIKLRSFQKLFTYDFTNSLGKIEFSKAEIKIQTEGKSSSKLKDTVRKIHEKFIQTTPNLIIRNKQEVPDFIRQRDQQKKEMLKIIQENQELQEHQENKNNCQIFFIELVLITSIIFMWKKIIENFQFI